MGSLQERIRRLQEENRARQQREETATVQREQAARVASEIADQIKRNAETQERNNIAKFLRILDEQVVTQRMEEVRRSVWGGHGSVVNQSTESTRAIKLLFKHRTQIPETYEKNWTSKEKEYYSSQSQGGDSYTAWRYLQRYESGIERWHKVVKPSYLEVGIRFGSASINGKSFPAFLNVVDTDVSLYQMGIGSFSAMAKRASDMGSHIGQMLREASVPYEDESGRPFSKRARSSHGGSSWHSPSYFYRLDTSFSVDNGVVLGLTDGIDGRLVGEFLDYTLALSSMLRQKEGKLPSQLR